MDRNKLASDETLAEKSFNMILPAAGAYKDIDTDSDVSIFLNIKKKKKKTIENKL